MDSAALLKAARLASGLSQEELARRSVTSRPTLSAYENGRKVPSLGTAERIVRAAGFKLAIEPDISFTEFALSRRRIVVLPDALWRLPIGRAVRRLMPPIHLNWSSPGQIFDLRDRADRARVYEIVLREGGATELLDVVDGAFLVEIWEDLVLPMDIRRAWQPVIDAATTCDPQVTMAS